VGFLAPSVWIRMQWRLHRTSISFVLSLGNNCDDFLGDEKREREFG
jgi:hypothetical protein